VLVDVRFFKMKCYHVVNLMTSILVLFFSFVPTHATLTNRHTSCEAQLAGAQTGEGNVRWWKSGGISGSSCRITSIHVAVVICAILVNTQTHIHR